LGIPQKGSGKTDEALHYELWPIGDMGRNAPIARYLALFRNDSSLEIRSPEIDADSMPHHTDAPKMKGCVQDISVSYDVHLFKQKEHLGRPFLF
jgi:hypothetical protein